MPDDFFKNSVPVQDLLTHNTVNTSVAMRLSKATKINLMWNKQKNSQVLWKLLQIVIEMNSFKIKDPKNCKKLYCIRGFKVVTIQSKYKTQW